MGATAKERVQDITMLNDGHSQAACHPNASARGAGRQACRSCKSASKSRRTGAGRGSGTASVAAPNSLVLASGGPRKRTFIAGKTGMVPSALVRAAT